MKSADLCAVRVQKITSSGSEGNCYSMILCFILIYGNIQGISFIAALSSTCIMVHTGGCGHFVELLCSVW
jgi:hypothetical protein